MQHRKRVVSAFPALLIALIFTICASGIFAQTGNSSENRLFEIGNSFNPPIEITSIRSNVGKIEPGGMFAAPDDWFKKLAVSVRNKFNQPVTYISISLVFLRPEEKPEMRGKSKLDLVVPLDYGISPLPPNHRQTQDNPPPLLPGSSVDLEMPDSLYDDARKTLTVEGFPPKVTHLKAYISMLGFSDGSIWIAGRFYAIDKAHPGKLIPLNR